MHNLEFLQPELKKLLLRIISTVLKIILEILGIVSQSGLKAAFFGATISLAQMGVLSILVNQYIIGSFIKYCDVLVKLFTKIYICLNYFLNGMCI